MRNEIPELKKRVSLVKYASGKTRLEKRGEKFWACCPIHGEKTPSFEIQVKDGVEVFHCHGCGAGGDIITFIEKTENVDSRGAIDKLKALAGVSGANQEYLEKAEQVEATFQNIGEATETKKRVVVSMTQWAAVEQALQNNSEALAWLLDKRGLTAETAKALHFGYKRSCSGHLNDEDEHARNAGWICFPRVYGEKILAIKMRSIATKAFSQVVNMEPKSLFNPDTVNALEPVFVTEGEFDAAVLEQCGYRAVSIPNANAKLSPEMKKRLKQAERVYLAGDNDGGVGNAYMKQLARELGENTYLIVWPDVKDANDFFLKTCKLDESLFREKVEALKQKAHRTPVEGFVSVLERLRNSQGTDASTDPNRLHFPWADVDAMNFSPAGSVVVIYSTYSGTGKTVFTTQVITHEAKRGEIVVAYSPELRDENYLALLAAQWVGASRPGGLDRAGRITAADYNQTAQLLEMTYPPDEVPHPGPVEQRPIEFYVGYSLPESDTDKVLDFIEFTVRVTGVTRFVIDTLHRIIQAGGRESLVEAEGRIVKRLEAIGNKYGTIFILIGQSNKEAEGLKETSRNEYGVLRGSRELTDVAYGVYLLHRPRMPKKGNETVNLLSPEGELVLMKDRGKGPGKASVPMLYRRDCSRFVVRDVTHNDEVPPEDEGTLYN